MTCVCWPSAPVLAGLRIGYEALAWGRHVNTYQQVWDIVRQADHPSLGVLLDSFHTLSLKGDPAAIAEIPGDKIFFVQMADAPILAMDVLEWSRHFRCFPGQGEFDLPGFLAPIIQSGYTGPLSLEIFNDGFRAAPPRANAADGLRSLLYLEEKTRQRLEQQAQPVANREILFETPKASEYNGIEFLEFAVDEALGAKLTNWLERLGFVKAGQHRSKSVSLLRQGDINLILNAEPYSFGHSFSRPTVRRCAPPPCGSRTVPVRWRGPWPTKVSRIVDWSAPTNWNWRRYAHRTAA
jgi:4-hydroxyphenylpyruvate dioxygenase